MQWDVSFTVNVNLSMEWLGISKKYQSGWESQRRRHLAAKAPTIRSIELLKNNTFCTTATAQISKMLLFKDQISIEPFFASVVEWSCPDVNKRWSVEVLPIGWAAVAGADDGDSWWNWAEVSPLSLLSATLSQCNSYCADLVKVFKWFLLGSSAAWFWPVLVKA